MNVTTVATFLRFSAVVLLAHMAWDDFKEFRVWDWELALFMGLAGGYQGIIRDARVWALAGAVALFGIIVSHYHLLPLADVVGMAGVVLLAPDAVVAAMYLVVTVYVDMLFRIGRYGFRFEAFMSPAPLLTELFVVVLLLDVGGWL